MEKFLLNLQKADNSIRVLDHIVYVSFPLIKDKKILLKVLLEVQGIFVRLINSVLHYEYLYERVRLSSNSKMNFRNFKLKCALRYGLSENDICLIDNLFELVEFHKKSSMDVFKEGKVFIFSDNMNSKSFSLEEIKAFLNLSKRFLVNIKKVMFSNF